MLKFSLRKGRSLNFTAGTSKTAELNELEGFANHESIVPEDLMAFISHLEMQESFE